MCQPIGLFLYNTYTNLFSSKITVNLKQICETSYILNSASQRITRINTMEKYCNYSYTYNKVIQQPCIERKVEQISQNDCTEFSCQIHHVVPFPNICYQTKVVKIIAIFKDYMQFRS